MNKPNNQPAEKYDSLLSLLARLFWMVFGNMTLFILTVFILLNQGKMFNAADVVFGVIVALLVLTRYIDIKLLGGFTVTDKPASMADWRKYTIFLLIGSTAVWVLSHAINYLFVTR
jgi:uncharacterized protein YhhL (DUF1145 family)